MSDADRNQMLAAMKQARDAAAALTGLREQLLQDGWDKHNAEQLVIEIIKNSGGDSQ